MHFDKAVEHLFEAEGGMNEASTEPGGGSNMGVSLTVLREHRKDPKLDIDDLKELTKEEAEDIYRERYWNKFCGDDIQGELTAIAFLDQAANRGLGGLRVGIVDTLRKHYAVVPAKDSTWGELIAEVNKISDREFFHSFVSDAQDRYVQALATEPTAHRRQWTHGWINRTQSLLKLLV